MSKIFIQDNFFDHNVLKEIQQKMLTSEFKSRYQDTLHDDQQNNNLYQRNYHHIALPDESDVSLEVKKNIKKHFNVTVIGMKSNYFLSFPNTPAIPHDDNGLYNCLIYLLGDTKINNGTGFYEQEDDKFSLHTHIGFKENRAIFFTSSIWHSPLQFAGESTPRYVLANFIYKNDKEEWHENR